MVEFNIDIGFDEISMLNSRAKRLREIRIELIDIGYLENDKAISILDTDIVKTLNKIDKLKINKNE